MTPTPTERERLLEFAKSTCNGQTGQISDFIDAIIAADFCFIPTAIEAPGRTDLMVTPESLDKHLEANPLLASEGERVVARVLMRGLWMLEIAHHDKPFEQRVVDREHDENEIALALAQAKAEARRETFEWCARKAENRSGRVGDEIAAEIRECAARLAGEAREC